jgi:hypothetical protein
MFMMLMVVFVGVGLAWYGVRRRRKADAKIA